MIYLFGAGGHAKVVIENLESQLKVVGLLYDRNYEYNSLLGYAVVNILPDTWNHTTSVIIAIGKNLVRKQVSEAFNFNYITSVHAHAFVSSRSVLGEGTVVMAGVSINCNVLIGRHVILNTNSSIDHDCFVADFVHISPNAALAGNVTVGEGTHIGIGSTIIQGIKIGKWVTVGAGAVVINDIPDYAVVVGNPAKIIKYQ